MQVGKGFPIKDKLITALRNAEAPEWMMIKAREGQYTPFLSDSTTPIDDLITDAIAAKLPSVIDRARHGEFDAGIYEAREWFKKHRGLYFD